MNQDVAYARNTESGCKRGLELNLTYLMSAGSCIWGTIPDYFPDYLFIIMFSSSLPL